MGQRIRKEWSDEENKILLERRKLQIPFKDIATELGRGEKSVYARFVKLRKKNKVTHKRMKAGKLVDMIANENKEAAKSRPMFALVGERAEIAQTLRELFS